jgi:hypothetical protein
MQISAEARGVRAVTQAAGDHAQAFRAAALFDQGGQGFGGHRRGQGENEEIHGGDFQGRDIRDAGQVEKRGLPGLDEHQVALGQVVTLKVFEDSPTDTARLRGYAGQRDALRRTQGIEKTLGRGQPLGRGRRTAAHSVERAHLARGVEHDRIQFEQRNAVLVAHIGQAPKASEEFAEVVLRGERFCPTQLAEPVAPEQMLFELGQRFLGRSGGERPAARRGEGGERLGLQSAETAERRPPGVAARERNESLRRQAGVALEIDALADEAADPPMAGGFQVDAHGGRFALDGEVVEAEEMHRAQFGFVPHLLAQALEHHRLARRERQFPVGEAMARRLESGLRQKFISRRFMDKGGRDWGERGHDRGAEDRGQKRTYRIFLLIFLGSASSSGVRERLRGK